MNEWLSAHAAWLPLLIFLARIVDVSLGTMRLICVTRGQRTAAVALAFAEIVVWIYVVGTVFHRLDHFPNVVAYAAGFATGNAVGMWLEQHLGLGVQMIGLISRGRANAVAEGLRLAGLVVTTLHASGRDGPIAYCLVVVARKRVTTVLALARSIDPSVQVTVSDVRKCSFSETGTLLPGKLPIRLNLPPAI